MGAQPIDPTKYYCVYNAAWWVEGCPSDPFYSQMICTKGEYIIQSECSYGGAVYNTTRLITGTPYESDYACMPFC